MLVQKIRSVQKDYCADNTCFFRKNILQADNIMPIKYIKHIKDNFHELQMLYH